MLRVDKNFPMLIRSAETSTKNIIGKPLPQKGYTLLSKKNSATADGELKSFVNHYAPNACTDCYTHVTIGKKSDISYKKEILTFYDKYKKIALRLFKVNGTTDSMKHYKSNEQGERIITTMKINPDGKSPIPNDTEILSAEFLKITELHTPKTTKEGILPVRVSSKKVEFEHFENKEVEHITLKHTPFNHGIGKPSDKRILRGIVTKKGNDYTLDNITQSDNMELDLDDKFLKVRFLDPRSRDGLVALTKQILKEKNIDKLRLNISTKVDLAADIAGSFSPKNRNISYRDFSREDFPEDAVDCVAHEVEHAYQIAQIGRLGSGKTSYETDAMRTLGEITDSNELIEAVKYSIASAEYPLENTTKHNPLYRDNYLEIKAREAGEKIADEFEKSKNYDFFEDFGVPL